MIYNDGYILVYADGTKAVFSTLNPTLLGPVLSETSYTIKDDDTLFSIAEDKYSNSAYWFAISEWNILSDPLALVTGTELKLPNFG